MPVGRFTRLTRFALLTAALAFPAAAAERRAIVTEGADYFGRDIGTLKDVDLDACEQACIADQACKAFTYNIKARWCFKKAEFGDLRTFAGATSGRIVEDAPADPNREETRRAELGFVDQSIVDEARQLLGRIEALDVPGTIDEAIERGMDAMMANDPSSAVGRYEEALRLAPERFDVWEGLSAAALAVQSEQWDVRERFNVEATAGSVNAYLRAADEVERARALNLLAHAFAKREIWRSAIKAARASLALQEDKAFAEELDGWIGAHGFRITENTVDTQADEPRICLTFSQPVAKDSPNIADFVAVEGGDTLAIEADGSQICVSGVDYGRRYHLVARQGLPAGDPEEKLQKTVELDVYVRDRDPQVHFVGRAYVLPRGPQATIPVASVNVDGIKAQVVRIGDRNLIQTIGEGNFLGQIGTWQVNDIADRSGEAVWEGTVSVKRETNREVVTAIPVGELVKDLKPGVYAMVALAGNQENEWGQQATQWFVVTDLGVSSLKGNDGLHAVVRSLSSAGGVSGATVKLLALNNEVLGSATTDAEGYARFDPGLAEGTGGNAPALLTVEGEGGDFAFLDLTKAAFDLTDRGVEGRAPPQPVDVFMTPERGVYRPGETVNVTTLARDPKAVATDRIPLTFVVSRPDGVEHLRSVVDDEGAGGRDLAIELPGEAMRGTWRLAAYTDPKGASLAEATFLVEDFQPERIDFTVKTEAKVLKEGETAEAELNAQWLYGAPASNLNIEGEVYVKPADSIPAAPGYSFGLRDDEFSPVAEPIQGGPTNEDGNALVDLITPALGDTTRPLDAAVHVRVLDTNGRPVERRMTLPVSDGRSRIGVDPQFADSVEEGGLARFDVLVLDGDNEKADLKGVSWELLKVDTRYQWYNTDGSWNYEPIRTTSRVAGGTIDVAAAEPARIEAQVEWGEYELTVEDPNGGAIPVSYAFEAGWYVPPGADDTPDLLKISLDKKKYAIGDTLVAHLDPRFSGVALIRVVDDRLVTMKTVEVAEGGTDIELPVTADWGPGAYVTATLLRPGDIPAKRMPARALGLAYAAVDPGDRVLDVALNVPAENKPRTALPVEVALGNVAAGEEAYVTLAAVDVGILNLTQFKAPAPEDWYFAQRRLGVEFRDVYGQLIDSTIGALGQVRTGGDGGGIAKLLGPPPTERLVAFYQGVTKVDADGKARASFDIPDFNGTVRVMAIAWSKSAVGHASTDVLIRDPIVIQSALPNFLAPGDRSRLKLDFVHLKGPTGDFKLEVAAAGSFVKVEPGFSPKTVPLADKGKAEVLIPLTAVEPGDETVTVTLTAPDGSALVKTLTVPVRSNEPAITRVSDVPIAKAGQLAIDGDLVADLVPGTTTATVTVGNVAGIDLPGLVRSLDKYPYGCSEQITSRALPLVYLDDVVLAAGLAGEQPVKERVAKAVAQVLVNQGSNGSFGLWQPGSEDLWLDAYVTDFLTRAKEKGVFVPPVPFDLAVTNLKNRVAYASDFTSGGEDVAYALYVLARNGRAAIGDLRYYAETKLDAFTTPLAKAQLGAALALYGDMEKADRVFRAALGTLAGRPDKNGGYRSDYGSDLRDSAAILTLASETKVDAVDVDNLSRTVQALANGRAYASTQEQAWMLLAANALLLDGRKAAVEVNGERKDGVFTARYQPAALREGVTVVNKSDFPVDARVTVTGVPVTPEPAGGNGYAIKRVFYDLEGNEVDPSTVPLGARLVVVLTVTTTESYGARLMVDDPLPAGFAIDNPSLVSAGDVEALSWLSLVETAARTEYRADRFLAAIDSPGSTEMSMAYMVRAVAPGSFNHPAATVVDMYRPEKQARTGAGKVEVMGALQ